MVEGNKLKAKIIELGMNVSELCKKIHMDQSTFYRKVRSSGCSKFTIGEAHAICDALGMKKEDAAEIFLAWYSHKCD
jgi:predicted transcriptional regulator